jgi:DNA (cytosine-5)-methyltransferase 1
VSAYYNENNSFLAGCLRNLIEEGLIADGVVDERSIIDVRASDLRGFAQVHLFAGIGGWPYALRLAGWPDDKPVWTGSCPCQPLSGAGLRRGHLDERHLWPAFHRLVAQRRPAILFGEQVASGDGPEWLAGVRADLEDDGYAFGAANLCAAGVGAPHDRARLYFVAHAHAQHVAAGSRGQHHRQETDQREKTEWGEGDRQHPICRAPNFWAEFETRERRRLKPGSQLLVDGFPTRLAQLYALGNAIVPQLAVQFIVASREAIGAMSRRERYQGLDAFDRASQRPAHRPAKSKNVHSSGRPSGNSAAAFLRRLRAARPDLHARVLAGEISAYAGMIEAGWRTRHRNGAGAAVRYKTEGGPVRAWPATEMKTGRHRPDEASRKRRGLGVQASPGMPTKKEAMLPKL